MLHTNWYKKGGYNRHSNILYHFINDTDLTVTDISSKQDINYTYFCDATSTYTWIDHCLSTSHDSVFDCKILPRHADNVKPGVHTNDFAPIHRLRALKLGHASLATVFRPGRLTLQLILQWNLESPVLRYQPITTAVRIRIRIRKVFIRSSYKVDTK